MDSILTEYFYILGLPRSRTLWLSYVLSDKDTKCYHEALTCHGSQLLNEKGYKYVGSVDTNPLNKFTYNGKLAVIKRDPEDVKKSITEWFTADQFGDNWEIAVNEYVNKYNKALNRHDTFTIDYEDLNDIDKLVELITYLKPETKIDRERLLFLQNTIIKVKNTDLTDAINHTSRFTGSALTNQKNVVCRRTYDVGYCYDILTNKEIFNCISEDTATLDSLNIDVMKDYWLEIVDFGVDIGVFQLKQTFNKCWEAHIHILPEHREEYTEEAGQKIWSWVEDNLKEGLIVTNVPKLYPNVREFLLRFGFEDSGCLKNAWFKNGQQHDMWILTRSI